MVFDELLDDMDKVEEYEQYLLQKSTRSDNEEAILQELQEILAITE